MTVGSGKTTSPASNEWLPHVAMSLSAAGNAIGNALAIPVGQDLSIFTTVNSGQGCQLPLSGVSLGETYQVANHGSNALLVYPSSNTAKMGTASAGAGYSLAAGKSAYFTSVGLGSWTTCP